MRKSSQHFFEQYWKRHMLKKSYLYKCNGFFSLARLYMWDRHFPASGSGSSRQLDCLDGLYTTAGSSSLLVFFVGGRRCSRLECSV